MSPRNQQRPATVDLDSETRAPQILVAEDDARMRELLVTMLAREGYTVAQARDGAELLELIAEFQEHPRHGSSVDLIITDIRMPTLSGLDVLTELCWDGRPIPVILITAFGDEETHAEAIRLGAVAVFDKPFQLDAVRTAVKQHLGTTGACPRGRG